MSAVSRIPVPIRSRYASHPNQEPQLTQLEQLRNDFQNKLQHDKQVKQNEFQQQQYQRPPIRWQPDVGAPSRRQRVSVQPNNNGTYLTKDSNVNYRPSVNNRVTNVPLAFNDRAANQREGGNRSKIRYNGQDSQVIGRRDREPKIYSTGNTYPKNGAGRDRANPLNPIGQSNNRNNQVVSTGKKSQFGNTYTVNMAKQRAKERTGRHLPIQRRETRVIRPIDKTSPWPPIENVEMQEKDKDSNQRLTAEERQQLSNLKQKQLKQLSKYQKIGDDFEFKNNNPRLDSRTTTITNTANRADSKAKVLSEIPTRQKTDDSEWLGRTRKPSGQIDLPFNEAVESESPSYPLVKRKLKSTENLYGNRRRSEMGSNLGRDSDNESRGELSNGVKNRLPIRSRLDSNGSRLDDSSSRQAQHNDDDDDTDIRLKKKKIFERQRLLSRQFSEDDIDDSALREKEEALQKLIRQHSVELSKLKREAHRIHRRPELKVNRLDTEIQ